MKLAILIDFHNLFMMLGKDQKKTKSAIEEIMKMGRRKGEITEARLFVPIYFVDENREKMWDFINTISLTFGLEMEACSVSSIARTSGAGIRMKDSVDNAVMMHIVRNVHPNIGAEVIVFVTGDGDFLKFSIQAQNKGKRTEFWSVDPSNTNRFIKTEGGFQEIETDPEELRANPFVTAVHKFLHHQPLDEKEKQRIRAVARLSEINLQAREFGNMAILISGHCGISIAESEHLLHMLVSFRVAEIRPTIAKCIEINEAHGLFRHLRT